MLLFVQLLFVKLAREAMVLLDCKSIVEVEIEEEVHGEVDGGVFSSFSTSLCNLEVSDVGVETAMEDGTVVAGL